MNVRHDYDLTRLWCRVSPPSLSSFLFRASGNPETLKVGSTFFFRTELLEKCQWWKWLLLIGSSSLESFIRPLTEQLREGGRGGVLCYIEPLGAVLYKTYFGLQLCWKHCVNSIQQNLQTLLGIRLITTFHTKNKEVELVLCSGINNQILITNKYHKKTVSWHVWALETFIKGF